MRHPCVNMFAPIFASFALLHTADCGVPLVDSSLNLTYNSTLEASVLVVLCDEFAVEAFCHRNGSWSPQLAENVCNFASPMTTG